MKNKNSLACFTAVLYSLVGLACGFLGNACWSWEGWDNRMSRKKIGGEDLHDALELGAERKGRSHQAFCYRAWGMRLGDWIRRKGERCEVSLSASLV